jgi:hypothetical protein
VCKIHPDRLQQMEDLFKGSGLGVQGHKLVKKSDEMICIIDSYGAPKNHEQLMEKLLSAQEVIEFRY